MKQRASAVLPSQLCNLPFVCTPHVTAWHPCHHDWGLDTSPLPKRPLTRAIALQHPRRTTYPPNVEMLFTRHDLVCGYSVKGNKFSQQTVTFVSLETGDVCLKNAMSPEKLCAIHSIDIGRLGIQPAWMAFTAEH